MDLETAEPQREALRFPVDTENVPPFAVEVVQAIKKVAEQHLYHWKTFPIILPSPLAVDTFMESDSTNRKVKVLNLRDVFTLPAFDELDAVALDVKSEPCHLHEKQLQNIRQYGEFEVESLNFPGQLHRWRLSAILQKGTIKTRRTLLKDIALGLRLLLITARNRIESPFFSLSQSARALVEGLLRLLDVFFGVPSLIAKNLDLRICEERSKYLVAELTVKPNLEDDLDNLSQFIRHQIHKQSMEKYQLENEKPPPVPCIYQTPKEKEIDLRLFNRALIRRCLPILASILEKEARNWYLPFRERIIAELKTKKLSEEDIERRANIAVMDEYLHRVFESVLANSDIDSLEPGIGQLLVEHAEGVVLMHRAVDNIQHKLEKKLDLLKGTLEFEHPILSLIGPWVRQKLQEAKECFVEDHRWDAHEEAISLCKDHHLSQNVYFLQRDATFMREREPVLKSELSRVRQPKRTFQWRTQIWCPGSWRVRKVFQGHTQVLPTVISRLSASLAQPRADPNQPVYLVEKQTGRTSSSQWPFWRWWNYYHRTWTWAWNAMFLFGVVIPWCSPVSLRALFSIRPFMPDLELSQIDGVLYPRKTSLTHTFCSRLFKLWRHISKSRTEFESRPDTGFIGKGFSRHLNRVWNYFVKGLLGTLAITIIFPIVCLFVSTASLLVAMSAPVWVPASTLLFHLSMILAYDFDGPDESRNKICLLLEALVWFILIQGFLQPFLAIFAILLLCPISALVMLLGIVRCGLRYVWDGFIFHVIIKKRGRVPAEDSWMVRRIAGPGLSDDHFFRIQPEQALAALEGRLELEELNIYREEVEKIILQPQHKYSEFVSQCFQPFSASLCHEGVFLQLERQSHELVATLRDQVERRKKELQTGLSVSTRSRTKMSVPDLQTTLRQSTIMMERFYPMHIFCRMQSPEQNFWDEKGLRYRDWTGLAAQLLSEIFSTDILTPLEDTDVFYKLQVQAVSLEKYSEMLKTADDPSLDVDVSAAMYTPKGKISVHAPYLDLVTFNPISSYPATVVKQKHEKPKYPWKPKKCEFRAEKLLIPLPIPHPVEIALIIYNRENEDPIPLEKAVCQEVLKAIQDGCRNSTMATYDPSSESAQDSVEDEVLQSSGAEHPRLQRLRENSPVSITQTPTSSEDHLSQTSRSQRTSGSIVVNLASTEDITLEPDGQCVTYSHSSYSTTV